MSIDEFGNFTEADGAITLTVLPAEDREQGHDTALLTVRGKDHDLTAAQLRRIAAACNQAAVELDRPAGLW